MQRPVQVCIAECGRAAAMIIVNVPQGATIDSCPNTMHWCPCRPAARPGCLNGKLNTVLRLGALRAGEWLGMGGGQGGGRAGDGCTCWACQLPSTYSSEAP